MRAAEDVDVAVVGAGHNGLAATALLSKRGLRVCGAACHPGPGVTFLPGYGAAYEVAEALAASPPALARGAA